jgi:hypothetical protein
MTDRSELRERYLRDSLQVQLGGVAANLARVRSSADNPAHRDVVAQLLEESAWCIEWAAPGAPLQTQLTLVDCQRQLAQWRRSWAHIWADPKRRADVAERAGAWSHQMLDLSGLMQAAARGETRHRARPGASVMKSRREEPRYVVCVANEGYRISLVVRRIYQVLPDRQAAKRGMMRVIDESGEDYLYPKKLFAAVDLPSALSKKFAVAT